MEFPPYDTAQICLNGHVINTVTIVEEENNRDYCSECGAKTITLCGNCHSPIKGRKLTSYGDVYPSIYKLPRYCDKCGSPYPWTLTMQQVAFELVGLSEELTESEKEGFRESIIDIVKDSPKTGVAVIKFKKYAVKAGTAIASSLKDILVDVVSEAVKKAIWG